MFRITILLIYIRSVQTMTPITKYLLTPLEDEGCGYESCHRPVKGALNIHIVPHTHGELGTTRTFENHFTGRDAFYDKSNINMKRIIDFIITELWSRKDRKFVFKDFPYLYKWWTIRDGTVKRMVYQLIRQGRLHFVGGGWSMTDEATANYQAIIDHFTYSLRKLNATFLECARPLVTWQSDSFGHTSEFASLMAQMGFDGHFINPISYDDELQRMKSQRLEFIWRGSPDLGASSEIFTHKLFDGYWSPPGFCFGGQCGDPIIIDTYTAQNNVEQRVKLFLEGMEYRQGPHYSSNHVMVMMGQRFGYYDAPLWFSNIDKLIQNVNSYVTPNKREIIAYYSTPACYLKAVHESNSSFTVETDDFVPIAYDKNTHFSGIFTSRPTLKYAVREGNIFLQITRQLQVLARLKKNEKFYEDFNWIMGVLQDHNVLSGGMRPFVRDYYVNILYKTMKSSEGVVKAGLVKLMKTSKMDYPRCLFNISYCEYTDRDNFHIVVYNPLAWSVTMPVRLPINEGRYVVFLPNLKKVDSVLMKIPSCIKSIPFDRKKVQNFELVFLAEDVPGLGYRSYFIEKITRMKRSEYNKYKLNQGNDGNGDFDHISNDGLKIEELLDLSYEDEEQQDSGDRFNSNTGTDVFYNKYNQLTKFNNENDADLISRKVRSAYYNKVGGKIDKLENIDDYFKNNGDGNFEFVQLHDVNRDLKNLNHNLFGRKTVWDIDNFKEPRFTKKKAKTNKNLKSIFETIKYDADKIEEDIFFENAIKKTNSKSNKTSKNTDMFNSNESNKDNNEKRGDKVTKYIPNNKKDYTTSKPNKITTKNNSDSSNKFTKTNNNAIIKTITNDTRKYVKNKQNHVLQGLKRCNCKTGRLKRDQIDMNSQENNDTVLQTFGNKTLRFIHFKQEEAKKEDASKAFKREIKVLKENEKSQIETLKREIKNLKLKIQKHRQIKHPKEDEIRDLKREIKEMKREIENISKTNNALNETRLERSLFKKIKNAKKKYLRRQTNNLKIDDESLLSHDHYYDDDQYLEQNREYESTTEALDRYVLEHNTDLIDYVVTPKPRDEFIDSSAEETTRTTTPSTTEETTTPTTTTTTTTTKTTTTPTTTTPTRTTNNTPTTTRTTTTRTTTSTRTTTKKNSKSTTTKTPHSVMSILYSDTTDSYISNQYINITVDQNKNISYVALSNGLVMALNINFYYFASDDPMRLGKADVKKPGAYVFRPMDPEPVFKPRKYKVEVYKSSIVEEIHSNSNFASFVVRLYKNMPYFEVEWILREIPVSDGVGKDVFIRYDTDLSTDGVFYTDANGRQTIKRVYGHRPLYTPAEPEAIAGNYYPVTSKITIEDPRRMIRFSVFNDRTQGGSSFNGEIDLMLNRRILTDDAGFQSFINETENDLGTTVSGKHYIYMTKLSTKVNKIFEKKLGKEIGVKPQVFVSKRKVEKYEWKNYRNEFFGVKKIPVGLNILTLQEWNDGSYLIRIENYLEKSDVVKSGIKKLILRDLFHVFRITKVRETTLAGNIFIEDFEPWSWKKRNGNTENINTVEEITVDKEISFKPQQIRTFIIWVEYH